MRSGLGPAPEPGQAARLHDACRRHRAQAFDEIVDVRIEGGEMPAGAGGDPAAQSRELEALRVMPDGEAVRLQRRLDRGAANASLNARGAARRVDLEHPVQAAHVEADRPGEGVADRGLDAAHDRGAGAEGYDGDVRAGRPVEHGGDIGLVLRQSDVVRRIGEVAGEGANGLRIGFSVSVQEPLVRV